MNKVTVEITENSYTTTLHLGGKTYTEKWSRTSSGAECTEGCFENEKEIPDELWESLSSLTSAQYDTMKQL